LDRFFEPEKENGYGVQARMNDRQRRCGKVWDIFLNNLEGVEFKGNL
jgi:hypothetical protein